MTTWGFHQIFKGKGVKKAEVESPVEEWGVSVKVLFADEREKPFEVHAAHCVPNDGFLQIIETTRPEFRAIYIPALQIKAAYVRRKVTKRGDYENSARDNRGQ